jgi:hypothetical protein
MNRGQNSHSSAAAIVLQNTREFAQAAGLQSAVDEPAAGLFVLLIGNPKVSISAIMTLMFLR